MVSFGHLVFLVVTIGLLFLGIIPLIKYAVAGRNAVARKSKKTRFKIAGILLLLNLILVVKPMKTLVNCGGWLGYFFDCFITITVLSAVGYFIAALITKTIDSGSKDSGSIIKQ